MNRLGSRKYKVKAESAIIKEPLIAPFGFKGGFLTELWQSIVLLREQSGETGIGLGVQSVLWSDPAIFVRDGEQAGNEGMNAITKYALAEIEQLSFETPLDLMDQILASVYEYGKKRLKSDELKYTFMLNALVPVDYAAWAIYSRGSRQTGFAELIPEEYRSVAAWRHSSLASVPLVSYGMNETDITNCLQEGYSVLKIKIGADPDKDGDQEKMLEWDKQRLSAIHRLASQYGSEHTSSGKILYYLDANGRYADEDRLLRLLDHLDRIGALESVILLEEPFPEHYTGDFSDIPVRLTADESIHCEADAIERLQMSYRAIALKPVAKTMSVTLKIAKLAFDKGIPCFSADLTANPLLVDWNKNLAAYLPPVPGLKVGMIETNGQQNYLNWVRMRSSHPCRDAAWTKDDRGLFTLNDEFFARSGGVFEHSAYYLSLFK